ncbi:hypothetical protein S83_064330 [Arachis hypogaea]
MENRRREAEAMKMTEQSDNQPPHSWDYNKHFDECLPEAMENRRQEAEAMKMTQHYYGSPLSGYQPLQSEPQPCAIDVCGNQPPQLLSQPQPQPRPWSRPLQSEPQLIIITARR